MDKMLNYIQQQDVRPTCKYIIREYCQKLGLSDTHVKIFGFCPDTQDTHSGCAYPVQDYRDKTIFCSFANLASQISID